MRRKIVRIEIGQFCIVVNSMTDTGQYIKTDIFVAMCLTG